MTTIPWRYYEAPGDNGIKLGKMASGMYDTNLARATAACYAQCRRNVICTVYNMDCSSLDIHGDDEDGRYNWANITIGSRIVCPGNLKIYLHTNSSSEAAGNELYAAAWVGNRGAIYADIKNVSLGWRTPLNVPLAGPAVQGPDEKLKIWFRTMGTQTLNIQGISCYQPADTSAPAFVDLDDANCYLGTADYPDSVRVMELLKDNCLSVRGYKLPRANVWCQWFADWHKTGNAYGADNKDLGSYRFPKRAGVSEIKCHYLAIETGTGNSTVKCTINDPDSELVNAIGGGAAQTNTVTGGLAWYTETWTFSGVDITNERNLELKIDAAHDDAAGETYVPGVYLVETGPSAAITHTVPNPVNCIMGTEIEAVQEHKNIRDTLNHLYYQGGKQILVADWRFYESAAYDGDWDCSQNSWSFAVAGGVSQTYNNTTVSRALLYSSTSSTRVRSRFEFSTDSTTSATKTIQTSLSDTAARGVANYYEANPRYDGSTNNLHNIVAVVDGTSWRAIEDVYMDIRSADWEEHYDGVNEPPQSWLGCLGNASGYIIPYQFSCEEMELLPSEFP